MPVSGLENNLASRMLMRNTRSVALLTVISWLRLVSSLMVSRISLSIILFRSEGSTPKSRSSLIARPSPSLKMPSIRCSGPI